MFQEHRLGFVGARDTAQADRPPVGGRGHHVGTLKAGDFLQYRRWAVAQARTAHPAFQGLAQHVSQEADQQVRLDPPGLLVPDGPQAQVALLDPEGGLRVGEVHVRPPQLLGVPVGHVTPQQVAALAGPRPGPGRGAPRPAERGPAVGAGCDGHAEQPGRPRVLAQQPSHPPLDLARVAAPPPAGRPDLEQARPDAGDEALPQGLLLGGAGRAAAEDEGLHAVAVRAALHLQALAERLPAALPQGGGELLQAAPRRADDIPGAAAAEPGQGGLADHAAVQDPNPPLAAVAALHPGHDLLDGGAVVAVAGEDLVAQRVALPGDDQADEHLLAVAAVIARVAALRLRVGRGFALEVGAGDVVEQQVVLQTKEPAQPPLEMDL